MTRELSGRRRLLAVVLVGAVIAALALADRGGPSRLHLVSTPRAAVPGVVMPVAFPTGSLASTWFCAGGTAAPHNAADHTVILANPTGSRIDATLTAFPGALTTDPAAARLANTKPVSRLVHVASWSVTTIHLADVLSTPYVAALVEASGGGLVVEHRLAGADGVAFAPCATSGSPAWYFASGSVTQTTGEVLALFNPFADDAVVDLTFATSDGFRAPTDYQSLPIPAGHLVVVDVFAAIARHDVISTSIVAKSGRLVADRLLTYNGSPKGLSVALGAPVPAPVWWFPDGQVANGVKETYTIYNPSAAPASVDLEVALDSSDAQVDPIPVDIDPHGVAQVVMNDEQRIPPGLAYSVTVRSANRVPVVVERQVAARSPSTHAGVSDTLGSPLVATHWVFAAGQSTATSSEYLVIRNPSEDTIARVRVAALTGGRQAQPISGLSNLEVPANGRLLVDLGAHITRSQLPLLVTSTEAVVVERSVYASTGPGLCLTVGVPLADGVSATPP